MRSAGTACLGLPMPHNARNVAGEAGNGGALPRANLAGIDFNRLHRATSEPRESIADLKARADLVEIAGRQVALKRRGRDWWACCPFHGERTPSFKINPERQAFYCFGCDAKGDVLDFLAAVEGLDLTGAIQRLRELLGGVEPGPRVEAERAALMAAAAAQEAQEAAQRKARALQIWHEAEPLTRRSPELPVRYLTERRGLSSWHPSHLRWYAACPWQAGTAGCIVAPVHDLAGNVTAVWRIRPSMTEPMKDRRRGLGAIKGGCSRLFHAEGPCLVVAEGVEDALAARELTTYPAWAALSAANMAALVLPSIHTQVLILADVDAAGRTAAHQLARRLREEGREAKVLKPCVGKDANDVLRAGRAG
jgi:hypothetical protein